jgi:hypothetical protein
MTNDLKIDHDIPIPNRGEGGLTGVARTMNVGDSVLVPRYLQTSMSTLAVRTGFKFTSTGRGQPEGMIRIWRTE